MRRCLALLMVGQLLCAAGPGDDRVVASIAFCRPADSATIARLAADWIAWRGYIDVCPVFSEAGVRALVILTIRPDLAQLDGDPVGSAVQVPDARIIGVDGVLLGELPGGISGGLPGVTVITLRDWRDGRPWRIEMRELNAAAMGDFDLPVTVWNPARQRYEFQRPAGQMWP